MRASERSSHAQAPALAPAPPAPARPAREPDRGLQGGAASGLSGRPLGAAVALGVYACLSLLLYGHEVVGDPAQMVVGSGQLPSFYGRDQSAYVWFLAWAPHALAHMQNLFLSTAVFAPHGYNLAWAANILGPAILLAPLTSLIGAIATFNVLALAAPAGAAWTAFLLCRRLTRRFSSALAGGLLFGFGTYETVEMVNHLSLALVALLPLAVLLVLRRQAGETSRARFIAALGCLLALQLWTTTELFASMVLFGGLAFLIAIALGGRQRLRRSGVLAAEGAGALALAALLGAPCLYYALFHPNPLVHHSALGAGADLANFTIPTRVTWLHGQGHLATAAASLAGNLTERLGYMGPALLLLLVAFAVGFRRRTLGRCLAVFMLLATVASLGSHLVVDGHDTHFTLPWAAVGELPLLGHALPTRFVIYIWAAAGLATALWLDRSRFRPARWALFVVVAITLAPNVNGVWGSRVDTPALMSEPTLARYVPAGATVLALPFGMNGDSMYWQVQAKFRFRLAGGYVSWAVPTDYRGQSIIHEFTGRKPGGEELRRECGFISLTGAGFILLREHTPGYWPQVLDPLRVPAQHVGGFAVYDLAPVHRPGGACYR